MGEKIIYAMGIIEFKKVEPDAEEHEDEQYDRDDQDIHGSSGGAGWEEVYRAQRCGSMDV